MRLDSGIEQAAELQGKVADREHASVRHAAADAALRTGGNVGGANRWSGTDAEICT